MKTVTKLIQWSSLAVVMSICLAIVQCDNDPETAITYGDYPLEIGNTWLYRMTMPTAVEVGDDVVIDTIEIYYRLVADTTCIISDSILATGIAIINDTSGTCYGRNYVANLDDGFYRVGYEGTGIGVPGRFDRIPPILPGLEPGDDTGKSWLARTTSDYEMLLPSLSESGYQWSYNRDNNVLEVINVINGWDTIEVPYGKLSCVHKMKTIIFEVGALEPIHYDYAPCGMALLWLDLGITEVYDSLGFGPIAEFHMWEKIELVDYIPGR